MIKLTDQFLSFEKSKVLNDFGILQYSLYSWFSVKNIPTLVTTDSVNFQETHNRVDGDYKILFPAYSVPELGILLPDYLQSIGNLEIGKCDTDHVTMKRHEKVWWNISFWNWRGDIQKGVYIPKKENNHLQQEETMVETFGKMLIFLLENKFVTAEVINSNFEHGKVSV